MRRDNNPSQQRLQELWTGGADRTYVITRAQTPMRNILLCVSFALLFAACEPNRSIELSSSENSNAANVTNLATANVNTTPSPQKVTIAELMQRVANAPKDSFLFPCTLNAYSDADRQNLKKLRQTWLTKEQDNHYELSSATECVCPGICVLRVDDLSKPSPNNSALLVIDNLADNKYFWFAKNLDLTHTEMGWASSIPYIYFLDENGKRNGKVCSVEKAKQSYVAACSDGKGKKLPPLESGM
jgi:hypothetical protein